MGSVYASVQATEQLVLPKCFQNNGSITTIKGEDYVQLITHIFWQMDSQKNVIIGVKLKNQNLIRFKYLYQEPKSYRQPQEDIIYFKEKVIKVQRVELIPQPQIKEEGYLNKFISHYKNQSDPEQLINIFVCDGEIQDYSKDLDLNDSREGNYKVCYQNYLNENEVIFERQDKMDYQSFDFKKNGVKTDTRQFLYKYGIKLKNPLENKDEILKLCKKYNKSVVKFLETEKL
ncbi:unnamed protein product [Paramecium octaurelia]|uniref:Uncharacterized protein n=1 Tax=Paramecium octaurelia TaxID=43137 RepID=A0A8S1XI30_PAROT|nr:unnamed protein product [Paramecium octaurelia]